MNKQLYSLTKNTSELKRLISEHPDYDICVLAGEDANIGEFGWMYCSDIRFDIGEILDCDFTDDYGYVFCDRDDFEEHIIKLLEYSDEEFKTDDDFWMAVSNEMKKYDKYWKNVIMIYANN